MNKTPQSNRLHVSIFGETNSGKSSIFNKIIGQDIAIVSEIKGTTTDPVSKSIELLPFGPIVLIDTAGFSDDSVLGEKRELKTKSILNKTDLALYVIDKNNFNEKIFNKYKNYFNTFNIPYIVILNKDDLYDNNIKFENSISISVFDSKTIQRLKNKIIDELYKIDENNNDTLIGDILEKDSTVTMVVPIDSESPKGRLILPQVQLIRDCLDNDIKCVVTNEKNLAQVFLECKKIDLVVTDSKIFNLVDKIIPKNILLTSFSIIMAKQKGDIKTFIDGAKSIANLKNNDKILIAETCTHTTNHEDIGQIIIPKALKKISGKNLIIDFSMGKDFPENLGDYKLIIHCGGCMITKREMMTRIEFAKNKNIMITNYGLVLAMVSGIFERSIEFLK